MVVKIINAVAQKIAEKNTIRSSISMFMATAAEAAGNVGVIFIGRGFVPSGVANQPNQGRAVFAGGQIVEAPAFKDDPSLFKGDWWAIADRAGQVLHVDEDSFEGV